MIIGSPVPRGVPVRASAPSSTLTNGTFWTIRAAAKATSRDSLSSLATTTGQTMMAVVVQAGRNMISQRAKALPAEIRKGARRERRCRQAIDVW